MRQYQQIHQALNLRVNSDPRDLQRIPPQSIRQPEYRQIMPHPQMAMVRQTIVQ